MCRSKMNSRISRTRSWLKSKSITVPNDWLEACVEWINEENQNTNMSEQQTTQLVYEQWLLADLHELNTKCLPDSIADPSMAKYQLTGSYALQVDSMVDVSLSYYSQLQKLQGTTNANVQVSADTSDQKPWDPKPTRMLMMTLTDGTTSIKGMEYRTIDCLNTKLSPGTKIVVHGSILCRRGVLMLSGNNVTLLGGEVDTLMETNSSHKILQHNLDNNATNSGNTHKQEFTGTAARNNKGKVQTNGQKNIHVQTNQPRQQGQAHQQPQVKHTMKEEIDWDGELAMADFNDDFDDYDTIENNSGNNNNRNGATLKIERVTQPPQNYNQNGTTRTNQRQSYNSQSNQKASNLQTACNASANHRQRISGTQLTGNNYNTASNSVTQSSGRSNSNNTETFIKGNYNDTRNVKQKPQSSIQTKQSYDQHTSNVSVDDGKSDMIGDDFMFDDDAFEEELQMELDRVTDVKCVQNSSVSNNTNVKQEFDKTQGNINNKPPNLPLKVQKDLPVHSAQKDLTKLETKYSPQVKSNNTIQNFFKPGSSDSADKTLLCDTKEVRESVQTDGCTHSLRKRPKESPPERTYSDNEQRRITDFTKLCQSPRVTGGHDETDREPFTYLSIVNKQLPAKELVTFKVKAYISTLVGRLESVGGMEWKLACKINDGTASMEVDLSNGVLTELIGFSASDSVEMKKRSKQDKNVREVLVEGIQQCQQKLIELLCIMEIQTSPQHSKPVVVALHPITPQDLQRLHNRVQTYCDARISLS